ncbi:MAG TPA: cardiolipin synthase [Lachnospiraceae bacterium]|nr:cardiolipin synthase [Lachnospiraceae bacterium]
MMQIWDASVTVLQFIFGHLAFFNIIFAIIIVFFQRRDPKTVWTWLMALYFIPILGFILYLLIGTDMHKRKMFKIKEIEDKLNEAIRQQEHQLRIKELQAHAPDIDGFSDLVMFNLDTMGSVLTDTNDIDIYVDGNKKFDALIEDIRSAKDFIHIQYYIIKNDVLFNRIKEVLIEKSREGVEVRILYDAMGCRSVRSSFWRNLNKQGIITAEFFPALFRRLHLRVNYRNHRKIVVIDNRVAYVGGFNIGKEYIGLDPRFGYWRDTHLRIEGEAIMGLELRFLLDWNYTAKENLFAKQKYMQGLKAVHRDRCDMQIIYSGPDTSLQHIRDNYVRLIHKAKEKIYIQTPYFVPDEAMLTALKIAIYSGVEVNLMIPCKPDHPFVYWATYSYMGDLIMAGANCYTYNNGFLHSKGIIIDEKVFCYGTANMDIRSFSLNFEVNVVVYDEPKTKEMISYFEDDIKQSTLITNDIYARRSLLIRFKEQVSRLLSPLL